MKRIPHNPTDFQPGNLFTYNGLEFISTGVYYSPSFQNWRINGDIFDLTQDTVRSVGNIDITQVSPVVLTDKLLKKLNFKKGNIDSYEKQFYIKLETVPSIFAIYYPYYLKKFRCIIGHKTFEIEYVHQLQNLLLTMESKHLL